MAAGPGFYSRVVVVLKVALPLLALGMLSTLFLIQPDDRIGGDLVFSRGDLAALGSGLRIRDAAFNGTTRGGDAFRFEAEEVVPDAAPPTRAAITALSGGIDFAAGPTVEVRADRGDLDIPTQLLVLTGDVLIETSDGYRMRAERVELDLRAGTMQAGEPVATEGPLGRIDSQTVAVTPAAGEGDARRILFGNGVRVVYDPPSPPVPGPPCSAAPAC